MINGTSGASRGSWGEMLLVLLEVNANLPQV